MIDHSKLKNISILQNNQRNLSTNHLYIILIDFKKIKISKTSLMQKLMYHGVGLKFIISQYLFILIIKIILS